MWMEIITSLFVKNQILGRGLFFIFTHVDVDKNSAGLILMSICFLYDV